LKKCQHCGVSISYHSTTCKACGGNINEVMALDTQRKLRPFNSSWTSGSIWKLKKTDLLLSLLTAIVTLLGLYAIVMGDTVINKDYSGSNPNTPFFSGKVTPDEVAKTGAWQLVQQKMKHRSSVWLIYTDIRENTESHYLVKVKIGYRNTLGDAINDYFQVILRVEDNRYIWDSENAISDVHLSKKEMQCWKNANGWN
jgi:hypothetical protein